MISDYILFDPLGGVITAWYGRDDKDYPEITGSTDRYIILNHKWWKNFKKQKTRHIV